MRKEPPQLGAQGAGGFEDGEHEVDFRAHLEWIDGRFGVELGSFWSHSSTLRVVAVDPDESLPCYVVPCVFWTVLFSIVT